MSAGSLGKGATTLHPGRRRREDSRPRSPERIAAARSGRDQRWGRRRQLRKISGLKRCRSCGHAATTSGAGPTLGVITNPDGSRSAAYGGLTTCGSVWVCPVCAGKIATRRADDLATVMRAVDEAGGSAFMLTLTMRHDRRDRLGMSVDQRHEAERLANVTRDLKVKAANKWDGVTTKDVKAAKDAHTAYLEDHGGCWDVLGYAWSAVTSGAAWQHDTGEFGGLLGWARAVEATWSERNGWHVHIHVLLCFAEQVSAEIVAASIGARMFGRWRRALERRGFSASEEHGWDLRRAQLGDGDLADYFTKMAHEVTSGHRKETKSRGGRTPMQLLGEAVDTYEAGAMARWWEWEAASDGRRQLTWSTGRRDLRAFAGLSREATDEEIAAEDQDADVRIALTAEGWARLRRTHEEPELLDVAERGGLAAAKDWLTSLSLCWVEVAAPRKEHSGSTRRQLVGVEMTDAQ